MHTALVNHCLQATIGASVIKIIQATTVTRVSLKLLSLVELVVFGCYINYFRKTKLENELRP